MALNVKRKVFDIGKTEGFSYTLKSKTDSFLPTLKAKKDGF